MTKLPYVLLCIVQPGQVDRHCDDQHQINGHGNADLGGTGQIEKWEMPERPNDAKNET